MSHSKPVLSRFKQYYNSLPEQLGAGLLKDGIYELPGAWKFFTRLTPGEPVLLFCPGLTSVACAFARHASRVDVIGLQASEAALLTELAEFKTLGNIRILQHAADISETYATIIVLPRNSAPDIKLLRSVVETLTQTQTREADWWILAQESSGQALARIGQSLKRKFLRRTSRQKPAANARLFLSNDDLMSRSQVSALFAKRLPDMRVQLHLAPAFVHPKFIARPHPEQKNGHAGGQTILSHAPDGLSYLQRLLHHLNKFGGAQWRPEPRLHVLAGGKVQLVLCNEAMPTQPKALLKLPLVPHAEIRLRENAKTLTRLREAQELMEEQPGLFPQLLAQGAFESQSYHLESFLAGRSLDQLPAATTRTPAQIQKILQCWLALQAKFVRPLQVNETVFQQVFVKPAQAVQEWLELGADDRARMRRIYDAWHRQFADRELVLGLVHGDFSIKNIMADPGTLEITGFIDWDLADFCSIPLMDVLHFFIRLDARSFHDAPPAIALRLVQSAAGVHHNHFQNVMQRYDYRPEDWMGIVMLYWQHRLRGYLGSPKNYNPRFVRRQFFDVLALFEREVFTAKTFAGAGRHASEKTVV